jgi:hypothetical protein
VADRHEQLVDDVAQLAPTRAQRGPLGDALAVGAALAERLARLGPVDHLAARPEHTRRTWDGWN